MQPPEDCHIYIYIYIYIYIINMCWGTDSLCRSCKQLGHFAQSCPQKTTKTTSTTTKTAVAAEAIAIITAINETNQSTNLETGDHPNKEKGWTQVTLKGATKKSKIFPYPYSYSPTLTPAHIFWRSWNLIRINSCYLSTLHLTQLFSFVPLD